MIFYAPAYGTYMTWCAWVLVALPGVVVFFGILWMARKGIIKL